LQREQPLIAEPGKTSRTISESRRRWIWVAAAVIATAVIVHGADRQPSAARRGTKLANSPQRTATTSSLRIASFNIHHGVGRDGRYDLERVARTLHGFDIIALNEVAQGFVGNQAEKLATQLELGWLYAPSERRWWHDHWGNAVLSRFDVRRWRSTPLPGTRSKGYRCYVEVEIPWQDRTLTLLAVHIDRRHDREAQLKEVIERFLALPEPAVLLGDMNTRDDPHLQQLLAVESVLDPLAQKSDHHPRNDWILVRGAHPVGGGIRDIGASDHSCIWAEIELPSKAVLAGGRKRNQAPEKLD
jgi:endonuclease/exonuclease/phosphatase family metal-dependent hydrolase